MGFVVRQRPARFSITLESISVLQALRSLKEESMTDVADRPITTVRLRRNHGGNSIRTSLAKLTTLDQAARIRYGDMIDKGDINLSTQPLTLNGASLGDRKRQLRDWMMNNGVAQATAEAIASKLRPKVNYVHYMQTANGGVLLVETAS
jgi:hypothetical protein